MGKKGKRAARAAALRPSPSAPASAPASAPPGPGALELADVVEAVCGAVYSLGGEPAYGLEGVTLVDGCEVWDLAVPEGKTLQDVLDLNAPRVFREDWDPQHLHRYALAHRCAQCEVLTALLFQVVQRAHFELGARVLLAGKDLEGMGFVESQFCAPDDVKVRLRLGGQSTWLISPMSRMQHIFAYFRAGGSTVYVDLTRPQCGLASSLAHVRANPGTPYRTMTGDKTLGGAVRDPVERPHYELGMAAEDARLLPMERAVEAALGTLRPLAAGSS